VNRTPRLIRTAVAVAALAAIPGLALATSVMQDAFNYTNGNLVGQGAWVAHSSGGNKPIQVSTSSIIVQQSTGSGEDVNKSFPARSATDVTFASLNLKVPTAVALGTTTEYFAHFRSSIPAESLTVFKARVYVTTPGTATTYSLGLSTTSASASPVVLWPSQLNYGQTYKIVTSYDAASGTSTLWVDPIDQSSPSITSVLAAAAGTPVGSYAFRQASPSGATFSEQVNDLAIGTTFADVTPGGKPVPSLTQWGMMVLASLILAGGLFAIRRRATAVA
jgi:hypothetical protein